LIFDGIRVCIRVICFFSFYVLLQMQLFNWLMNWTTISFSLHSLMPWAFYIFNIGCSPGYLKHKLWAKKRVGSHYQFDSRTLKIKNRYNLVAFRLLARYHWKALDKGYNFVLDLTSIVNFHKKLWASKVVGVPTWEFWDKMTFGCKPHG
jgi:hypothetical protein